MVIDEQAKLFTKGILLQYIDDILKAKQITTYRLCKDTGLSHSYIYQLRHNTYKKGYIPSLLVLIRLQKAYNIPFDSSKYL